KVLTTPGRLARFELDVPAVLELDAAPPRCFRVLRGAFAQSGELALELVETPRLGCARRACLAERRRRALFFRPGAREQLLEPRNVRLGAPGLVLALEQGGARPCELAAHLFQLGGGRGAPVLGRAGPLGRLADLHLAARLALLARDLVVLHAQDERLPL